MMNIDKAIEILNKEVKQLQETRIRRRRQPICSIAMAWKTVKSWIQAVNDKMNAPMEDEYR